MTAYLSFLGRSPKTAQDHPNEFRAAQFTQAGGNLEMKMVQSKDPQEDEIVVKVIACGVSRSDIITKDQLLGDIQYPRTPCKDICGEVVQVHEKEERFQVGDKVCSGMHASHCFVCPFCRRGDFANCENEGLTGVTRDGGLAEYVVLRSEACARLPEGLEPAMATTLTDAGMSVWNALRSSNAVPGDVVVIDGMGGLAHFAVQMARAMGYRTISTANSSSKLEAFVQSFDDSHRRRLPPHECLDKTKTSFEDRLRDMGGAKIVVCTMPMDNYSRKLMRCLRPSGEFVLLAYQDGTIPIPLYELVMKRLSVVGWKSGTAESIEECLKFSIAHGIKALIQQFNFDQANDAWQMAMNLDAKEKPVVVF